MKDFEEREGELIDEVRTYEEEHRVAPCTDDFHNKHCTKGIDGELLKYYWMRSKGLIEGRPLKDWGCEPVFYQEAKVAIAFRDIDWNAGFTGRGTSRQSAEWSDAIGPHDETLPGASRANSMELYHSSGDRVYNFREEYSGPLNQTPEPEDNFGARDSASDDDDDVGPIDERTEDKRVGPFEQHIDKVLGPLVETQSGPGPDLSGKMRDILSQITRENLGESSGDTSLDDLSHEGVSEEDDVDNNASNSYSKETHEVKHHAGISTYVAKVSGEKRGRTDLEGSKGLRSGHDIDMPRQKRLRRSQPSLNDAAGQVKEDATTIHGKIDRSMERSSATTLGYVDHKAEKTTGTSREDRQDVIIKLEDDKSLPRMNVRPTYQGWFNGTVREVVEENEADDIVAMSLNNCQTPYSREGLPSPSRTPRLWRLDEEERLRFWVQDYGVKNWELIAWCLRRSVAECQMRCRQIIVARNLEAKRDPYAGLPEEILSETTNELPTALVPGPNPEDGDPSLPPQAPRPKRTLRAPKLANGEVAYDPKAKSLPKVAKDGFLVDSTGRSVPVTKQEMESALLSSKTRKTTGQKLKLTTKPRQQSKSRETDATGDTAANRRLMTQAGVTNRYDTGAWRFGVNRRAGNPRK